MTAAAIVVVLAAVSAQAGTHRPWAEPEEYLIQAEKLLRAGALDLLAEGYSRFSADPALAQAYAEQLAFAGRFPEAEVVFRRCAERDPRGASQPCLYERCRLGLAVTLLQLGRSPEASLLLQAEALQPNTLGWRARLYLARISADQGRFEEATSRLRELLPAPAQDEEALVLAEQARVAWLAGDSDAALAYITAAQASRPRPEFQLLRVLVLVWNGEITTARAALAPIDSEKIPGIAARLPTLLAQAMDGKQDAVLESEQLQKFPRETGGWLTAALGATLRGEIALAMELIERGKAATGSPLFYHTPRFLNNLRR